MQNLRRSGTLKLRFILAARIEEIECLKDREVYLPSRGERSESES